MKASVELMVECGPAIGLGHLRRCNALGLALAARGAMCRFAVTSRDGLPALEAAGWTAGLWKSGSEGLDCDAVVVDGYLYDLDLLRRLKGSVMRIVIDDLASRPLEAELLVNPNLYAE